MKPGATHTTFYRGKRVRVVLRNGEVFVAKFHDRTDRELTFRDAAGERRIRTRDLRSATIYKEVIR